MVNEHMSKDRPPPPSPSELAHCPSLAPSQTTGVTSQSKGNRAVNHILDLRDAAFKSDSLFLLFFPMHLAFELYILPKTQRRAQSQSEQTHSHLKGGIWKRIGYPLPVRGVMLCAGLSA